MTLQSKLMVIIDLCVYFLLYFTLLAKNDKNYVFLTSFRPGPNGKMIQNGKNITNPRGSIHGEQLVPNRLTLMAAMTMTLTIMMVKSMHILISDAYDDNDAVDDDDVDDNTDTDTVMTATTKMTQIHMIQIQMQIKIQLQIIFEHLGSGLPCKATSTRRMGGRLTSIHRRSSSSSSFLLLSSLS